MDYNVIFNEDCLQTMSRLDDDSVDLIVTSPPYNKNLYATSCGMSKSWTAMRGRQIAYDIYSDDMGRDEYVAWQKQIISECLRILKPCGSLFYNHKDVIVDGVIVAPTYVYDFPVHQHIIWNRGSSLANDPHYFQPITEHIYWIAKNPKNVYFDKKMRFSVKIFGIFALKRIIRIRHLSLKNLSEIAYWLVAKKVILSTTHLWVVERQQLSLIVSIADTSEVKFRKNIAEWRTNDLHWKTHNFHYFDKKI